MPAQLEKANAYNINQTVQQRCLPVQQEVHRHSMCMSTKAVCF